MGSLGGGLWGMVRGCCYCYCCWQHVCAGVQLLLFPPLSSLHTLLPCTHAPTLHTCPLPSIHTGKQCGSGFGICGDGLCCLAGPTGYCGKQYCYERCNPQFGSCTVLPIAAPNPSQGAEKAFLLSVYLCHQVVAAFLLCAVVVQEGFAAVLGPKQPYRSLY